MAQVLTRLNLASTAFPFLSEFSGRGIIVKQSDQNYVPTISSKEDLDKDIGVPQVYYCHNVIATGQGYQAVSYVPQIPLPALNPGETVRSQLPVIDDAGHKIYVMFTSSGRIFTCSGPTFSSWVYIQTIPEFGTKTVTYCVINGKTYVYVANTACYVFDFAGTNTFGVQTLAGITAASVIGVLACQGYMLVYSTNALLWSSLIDPTDFVPSLATGSGGGSVQNIRGDIVCVIPHTIGFIVYSNQNSVAATASNNTRYPFNFKELVASGGVFSKDLVTYDSNTGSHYAYTTSGLQLISLQAAQTVIPELTDFIAGSVFEDFNEATNLLEISHLSLPMKKRLVLIADRYLVISYGISTFTHALIYDTISKRWSKLRHNHLEVFEFSLLQAETTTESPRRSMAFLAADGSVDTLRIDTRDSASNGVLLLGKIQYIRQRMTSLQSVIVENVPAGVNFDLIDLYTLDGKTLLPKAGYLLEQGDLTRTYLFGQVGVNHSLLCKGYFNLVSIVAATSVHGRR
jgi:hypothetical protein